MKRKCISRLAVSAIVAIAMLAAVVQPSFAAPRPQHRVAAARNAGWLETTVFLMESFLLEKVNRAVTQPTPPPPPTTSRPAPPPTNGGGGGGFGGGPFTGGCLDPVGSCAG
jgi:hypothetical protein